LKWPDSKHNITPERPLSDAVDVWPWVPPFGALSGNPEHIATIALMANVTDEEAWDFVYKAFARVYGVFEACAGLRGYKTRWGGDWDGDGNLLDQNFHDLPHIEFVRS